MSRCGCWRRPTGTGRRSRSRCRPNAVLLDWLPYSQAMAAADLVISHGGHGTVVRALSLGAPLLVCPAVGDMGENGARVAWSGAGLSLPRRLLSPRGIRLAARRILGDGRYRQSAAGDQGLVAENDGAERAAELWRGSGRKRVEPAARRLEVRKSLQRLRGWDSNPQPLG